MQKTSTNLVVAAIMSVTLFAACNKNVSSSSSISPSFTSSDETITMSTDGAGDTTLTLRPNPAIGDDVYVNNILANPGTVDSNFNNVPELAIGTWTYNGQLDYTRSFIKFSALKNIRTTATVVSATLQLFSLQGSSLSDPQGNSVYPGSPYVTAGYTDNSALVQKVVATWKSTTLTWATQPPITELDQVTLPSSTSQWEYNPKINVTNIVKRMIEHPLQNYGFEIRPTVEQPYRSLVFGSCEATVSERPKLTIVYH